MTAELAPLGDSQALLERLGKRYLMLSAAGRAGLPQQPTCTFIIRSTRRDWTDACIAQVENEISPTDQILVVPRTLELAAGPYNIGYRIGIDGLNRALVQSTGDFIVVLQDRIRLTPQWIDRLLWPFLEDEQIAVTAPCSMLERHHARRMPCVDTEEALHAYVSEQHEASDGMMLAAGKVSGCCAVIRRSSLAQVGGVDDRIRQEELQFADWCLRIRSQDYTIKHCADVYVHALFDWPVRNEDESPKRVWDYFCRKWKVEDLSEGQADWSRIEQHDPYLVTTQPMLSLEEVGLTQPLVSVIVLICSSQGSDAEMAWFDALERQSYTQMEWIVLRTDSAEPVGANGGTSSLLGVYSSIVAEIRSRTLLSYTEVEQAAQTLAHGRYILQLHIEEEYPSHYVADYVHHRFIEGG